MSKLTITIYTSNAAFADGAREHEVARLLAKLASTICADTLSAEHPLRLVDTNGNTVGYAVYDDGE